MHTLKNVLDIKDVTQRLIKNLLNIPIVDLESIDEPTILAIDDLTPSMISQLNTDYIKGIITRMGGKTSHSNYCRDFRFTNDFKS